MQPRSKWASPPDVTQSMSDDDLKRELRELDAAWQKNELLDAEYHLYRYLLCERLLDWTECQKHGQWLYEHEPNAINANNLAVAYLRTDPQRSVDVLLEGIDKLDGTLAMFANLAEAYARLGNFEEALKFLEKGENALRDGSPEDHLRLAHAYAVCGLDLASFTHQKRFACLMTGTNFPERDDFDYNRSNLRLTGDMAVSRSNVINRKAELQMLESLTVDEVSAPHGTNDMDVERNEQRRSAPDGWAKALAANLAD